MPWILEASIEIGYVGRYRRSSTSLILLVSKVAYGWIYTIAISIISAPRSTELFLFVSTSIAYQVSFFFAFAFYSSSFTFFSQASSYRYSRFFWASSCNFSHAQASGCCFVRCTIMLSMVEKDS